LKASGGGSNDRSRPKSSKNESCVARARWSAHRSREQPTRPATTTFIHCSTNRDSCRSGVTAWQRTRRMVRAVVLARTSVNPLFLTGAATPLGAYRSLTSWNSPQNEWPHFPHFTLCPVLCGLGSAPAGSSCAVLSSASACEPDSDSSEGADVSGMRMNLNTSCVTWHIGRAYAGLNTDSRIPAHHA